MYATQEEITQYVLTECYYLNDNGTIRKLMKHFGPRIGSFRRTKSVLCNLPIRRNDKGCWVRK